MSGRMSTKARPHDSEGGGPPDLLATQLAAASRGDAVAFALLYEALAPRVYGMVLRILRDAHQAQEVAHEVFLELWQTSGLFDPARGPAVTWVLAVAHRRAVDRVRGSEAARRGDAACVRSTDSPYDSTAATGQASLDARKVRVALAALSSVQREAVELAYFGGRTYRDISRLTEVPLGTAKGRIRDALMALRDTLSPAA